MLILIQKCRLCKIQQKESAKAYSFRTRNIIRPLPFLCKKCFKIRYPEEIKKRKARYMKVKMKKLSSTTHKWAESYLRPTEKRVSVPYLMRKLKISEEAAKELMSKM